MKRLLALDYGRKRIGLAASDSLGLTAQPITTLEGTPEQALTEIAKICAGREIELLVLGLPFNMDGSEGPMAAEVRAYSARLTAATGLPVEFCDERLSSFAAEEDLRQMGVKRRRGKRASKERGRLDAMAAAVILREYMGRLRD